MISRKQRFDAVRWLSQSQQFLSSELANYPGRLRGTLRLTLACTVSLVLVVLFRLPGATLGAFFPFLLARDGLRNSVRSVALMSVMAVIATADVLFGAVLFAGSPLIHVLWIGLNLLVVFFLISVCRSYETVLGFGLIITAAITLWDQPLTAQARMRGSLYTLASVLIACVCTLLVEAIFQSLSHAHFVRRSVTLRLSAAADYLKALGEDSADAAALKLAIQRLSHRGIASDRRHLRGFSLHPDIMASVALSGRLVDLIAVWNPSMEERVAVKTRLAEMSRALWDSIEAHEYQVSRMDGKVFDDPMLQEVADTIKWLCIVLNGREEAESSHPLSGAEPEPLFAPDSISNLRHTRFAIRGALSAFACYLAYMSVGWSGLSSSLTTCILTAVPVLGATRHRQLLRFSGMVVGAGICGLLAESLFLSQIDSLLSFTIVFASFTFLAAWITSSTPRLAFAGLQVALAFDIVVLNRFSVSPQLIAARDCIFGILLGVLAMWAIFDHMWPSDSKVALRTLVLQAIKAHMIASDGSPQQQSRNAFSNIDGHAAAFRTLDRLEFLLELRLFEEGARTRQRSKVSSLKRIVHPLRSMTALSSAAHSSGGMSTLVNHKIREVTERTLLDCVDLLEGRVPRYEEGFESISRLEGKLNSANAEHGVDAEKHRRAAVSYLRSLRRLKQFSRRYFVAHYVAS